MSVVLVVGEVAHAESGNRAMLMTAFEEYLLGLHQSDKRQEDCPAPLIAL